MRSADETGNGSTIPFMKRVFISLMTIVVLVALAQAQFFPGNLAVFRAGDGTQTLANTGNSIFVDQFTPGGSRVNSLAIPASGVSALIVSGSATSEGALALSADGRYLTFAGYNTGFPYGSSLPDTQSSDVARGVGCLDANGNYTLAATTSTFFNKSNVRAAVSDGAGNYWAAGANSGTVYMGNNAAAGAVQTAVANTRVLNIINGNLYFSTGSGTYGIYEFDGTPSGGATASLVIATGASSSPYGFAINGTVAYIADDGSSAPGIRRYDYNGATWTLSYTLGTGGSSGARGLAVDFSGADPVIYATTGESSANRLIAITDTGATSTFVTLDTAAAKTVFRGVAFTPASEPGTWTLMLASGGALVLLRRWCRKPGSA
jgi:hypothetical protein